MSQQTPKLEQLVLFCPGCESPVRTWRHHLLNGVECPHCQTMIKVHRDAQFAPQPREGESMNHIPMCRVLGLVNTEFSLVCLGFILAAFAITFGLLGASDVPYFDRFEKGNAIGATANSTISLSRVAVVGFASLVAILAAIACELEMIRRKLR